MTSRERVRKVLNKETPDYIPNGFGGCETTGIHVLGYEKLKNIYKLPSSVTRVETFMAMGDNRGVTIGDELWRQIFKPHYHKLFQSWHNITGMKVHLHSCGSIVSILDDLIECGVDIYNPVQVSAFGMEPERLINQFSDKIIFWGGAYDSQMNSVNDSYDIVYQRVSENIKTFKQSGSYIFSGVHNLQPNIPECHLKAMLDAWSDNKFY